MMVQFAGKYVHDRDDNLSNFLEKLNMTAEKRKQVLESKPEHVVAVDGDTWTVTTKYKIKTVVSAFKLNQITEVEGGSEGKSKVIFTLKGNTLHQEGAEPNAVMVIDKIFDDIGMQIVTTHKPSNTSGSRYFKRV